jgi:hypothetical protein
LQESAYVPNSKPRTTSLLEGDECTFQQQKNYPNKIMKLSEEEWYQSDLQLANYAQNSHETMLLKMPDGALNRICPASPDLSGKSTGFVR